jgi:Collagen triple helix repeat (20 copies)
VLSIAVGCLGLGGFAAAQDEARAEWDAPSSWTGAAIPTEPLQFVAIAPCRILDTRGNGFSGEWGAPQLAAGVARDFTLTGRCGIPTSAQAVSANLGVTETAGAGFVLTYPQGGAVPSVSALNYERVGQTVANSSVVALGASGAITVVAGVASTQFFVDVNGYYSPANGVAGPAGPIGPQGPVGADGATGATGAEGTQGIPGKQGAQGITGNQGNQGFTGAPGPQGVPGSEGPEGPEGPVSPYAGGVLGANLKDIFAPAGEEQFIGPFGGFSSSASSDVDIPMPAGGAKNLRLSVAGVPAGVTVALTVYRNSDPTTLTCSYSGPFIQGCSTPPATEVLFAASDTLSVRYSEIGGDAFGRVKFSLVYVLGPGLIQY